MSTFVRKAYQRQYLMSKSRATPPRRTSHNSCDHEWYLSGKQKQYLGWTFQQTTNTYGKDSRVKCSEVTLQLNNRIMQA